MHQLLVCPSHADRTQSWANRRASSLRAAGLELASLGSEPIRRATSPHCKAFIQESRRPFKQFPAKKGFSNLTQQAYSHAHNAGLAKDAPQQWCLQG